MPSLLSLHFAIQPNRVVFLGLAVLGNDPVDGIVNMLGRDILAAQTGDEGDIGHILRYFQTRN